MTESWEDKKRRLLRERGWTCECCGDEPATELHHVFCHRMKGKRGLDDEENLQLVGEKCHHVNGKANGNANCRAFWIIQCTRYGRRRMREWLARLDVKIKPIYSEPTVTQMDDEFPFVG
jgi:hypothetical protein